MGESLIVTGASRGIGAAVATLAGARGYAVIVNFASDETGAQSVVREINAAGGKASAVQGDVAREDEVIRLFETAEREFGAIHGLVNNAGIIGGITRLESLKGDALTRVLAVNVAGSILCAREAVKRMSTRRNGSGGAIVNISSLAARTGGPDEFVHYAATKGAIDSFTIGLAREVGGEGIRVNAVAPGLIETGIHDVPGVPNRLERMVSGVPMQRTGTPQEVAEAVLWLLSPAASYITGTIVEVGGGR
ncbi:SDR family oxidoreductase [bacterium]|nr:MAG: SDR family oxidoreductase [bacterium]